jgi:predicted nucleic acid-binding protein
MYLLSRAAGLNAQNELWSFISDGLVRLHLPDVEEWRRIRELMNQYADMPLDMADASLISAAEQLGEMRLFSLDSRLRAIRIGKNAVFDIIP